MDNVPHNGRTSKKNSEGFESINPFDLPFFPIPQAVYDHPGLSDGAKMVYSRLMYFRGPKPDGRCFPGIERLALSVHKPRRTTLRLLAELDRAHLIRRDRKQRKTADCIFLGPEILDVPKMAHQKRRPDAPSRGHSSTGQKLHAKGD
jgi:hypothetical protein